MGDPGAIIAYILVALTGAGSIIALLFRLLIASKDREFAQIKLIWEADREELINAKKSLQDIATEAVRSAIETTNHYRAKEGLPPLVMAAAVVPESQSPSTRKQREAAEIQTLRAALANVRLAAGKAPRPIPEKAVEPPLGGATVSKEELGQLKKEIQEAPEDIADKVVEKLEDRNQEKG